MIDRVETTVRCQSLISQFDGALLANLLALMIVALYRSLTNG